MGWNNIDNKHKKHIDGNFVSCEEAYERSYIKRIIMEEYPNLKENMIDEAIRSCCASIKAPRPRGVFMKCLQAKLGGLN